MKESKKYLFTAIIYSSNDTLDVTLGSLLSQTETDPKDIQLIIMKDEYTALTESAESLFGSFGGYYLSEKRYPSQSAAYSDALKKADGRIVFFPQCGCAYSPTALSAVTAGFEKGAGEMRLAVMECSKELKTRNTDEFKAGFSDKGALYDINEKYYVPFIMLSNYFISSELDIRIDTDIMVRELSEAQILRELFSQTQALAVIRSRFASVSVYAGARPIHSFYEDFRYSHEQLSLYFDKFIMQPLKDSKARLGFVPANIQFNALYFLRWTFTAPAAEKIFEPAMSVEEYKSYLKEVLSYISDDVIGKCGFALGYRYLIMKLRSPGSERSVRLPENKRLYFDNTKLCDISGNSLSVNFVEIRDDKLMLHGRVKYLGCPENEHKLYALIDGEKKQDTEYIDHPFNTELWGEIIYPGSSYRIEIDLSGAPSHTVEFYSLHSGDVIKRRNITFGKFSPIDEGQKECYYYSNGYILTYDKSNAAINIRRACTMAHISAELRYERSLRRMKSDYAKNASYVRFLYFLAKPFHKKRMWLISDRTGRADDNGEAFLKYMSKKKDKSVEYYFVIDKNCEDGKRLSKIAKIIQPNSRKHKFYHLLTEAVVSSQSNDPVVNPLHKGTIYYRDILSKLRIVFLQHGVIKDDMSAWANLYNRNLYGFVVTTKPEYQSILDYNYFYEPKNVWLTGLPRHDYLYDEPKKYITFLPTWRKYMMKPSPDPITGQWLLRDDLPKDNEFSSFYNGLFRDERLLAAAKQYGYTLCFKAHPIIEPYLDRIFEKNDNIKILGNDVSFRDMYAWSSLMLTDFSSAVFDFAYLRKPIVYTHFDLKTFREGGHSYIEGYYDYERDGFGEVTYDLDSTVDIIIEYMKNDCKIKDKYLQRINEQFAYNDKCCCERVYEKLIDREQWLGVRE